MLNFHAHVPMQLLMQLELPMYSYEEHYGVIKICWVQFSLIAEIL